MTKKVLSLMNVGSMRKMVVIFMIAIFMVVCSGSVYAQQVKTTVDKEKFDKLTPEQKEKFKSDQEKARDTALDGVKAEKEVLETAKDAAGTVARYTKEVTVGAMFGGPVGALAAAVNSGINEVSKDNAKKESNK